jgi:hypothetical protein
MSGHAPGPWGATTRQGSWDWLVFQESDPNIEICQMFHDGTELNERGEANARLVAAAPDLLATLREIVTEIRAYQSPECDDAGTWGADLLKQADAAIAKATGRKTG